jgi:uncharacterized protein (DUF302 family)
MPTQVLSKQKYSTRKIEIQRFSVIACQSFENVVAKLEAAVSHPDMQIFTRDVTAAKSYSDLEQVISKAVGSLGLMEFARFNMGEILNKESGTLSPRILRFVIGNPLIMKRMAAQVPDAASYAPVTVLIDERADGVHLSYDRMASYLAPYGNAKAVRVARELDDKIEALLAATSICVASAA